MMLKQNLLLFAILLVLQCAFAYKADNITDQLDPGRKERIFSLFSIVTFKNSQCTSKTDSVTKGTCYTASECSSKGGISNGNCAAGFGVCCVFTVSTCGSTVSQNCTYVQNPGYPSAYVTTAATTCTYSISPVQPDICQLRLDFTNFVTSVTAVNGLCVDSFIVTSPTGLTNPTVCGTLTDQHMYVETGSKTTPTTLTFSIAATTATRSWKMKVSQIECSNKSKAPADCRQYFTGVSGSFKSYNHAGGLMLQTQSYTNCFRQEVGYCAIDYSESATTSPDAFQLGVGATGLTSQSGCAASVSFITIPTDTTNLITFCGSNLVTISTQTSSGIVRDSTAPFTVSVTSYTASQVSGSGFSLVYNQVPCD